VPVEDYTATLEQSIAGLRLAVPTNFFFEDLTVEARSAFDAAVDVLRALGATVEELDIPHGELAGVLQAILLPEAYTYHATDLAELPQIWPAARASHQSWWALLRQRVHPGAAGAHLAGGLPEVLRRYDLMLTPARRGDAPRYEEMIAPDYKRGPPTTGAFSLTGLPSLAVRRASPGSGATAGPHCSQGGRLDDEATVLRVAHAYHRRHPSWHTRHPKPKPVGHTL
jgi:aspartyl-tRNA(Asn)/glutamyl-tRNA(Gln) amidotransferase subunit A